MIAAFTLLQLVGLGTVYGITKAGVREITYGRPEQPSHDCNRTVVCQPLAGLSQQKQMCANDLTSTSADRAQIVGSIFPVFIMALVPVRQYILPRFFRREHLRELDAAPYEEAPPVRHPSRLLSFSHNSVHRCASRIWCF